LKDNQSKKDIQIVEEKERYPSMLEAKIEKMGYKSPAQVSLEMSLAEAASFRKDNGKDSRILEANEDEEEDARADPEDSFRECHDSFTKLEESIQNETIQQQLLKNNTEEPLDDSQFGECSNSLINESMNQSEMSFTTKQKFIL
jgi:hypothetical protein